MKINFAGVETNNNVPVGVYDATVFNIEYKQTPGKEPGFNWTFIIQNGQYKGRKTFGYTSLSKAALFSLKGFVEALTGAPVEGEFDFDPNQFLGKACKISVEASGDPKYGPSVRKLIKLEGASANTTAAADPLKSARMF